MDFRAVLVVLGIAAVFCAAARWKLALQLAFVLVIAEGAIRKWLIPGAQDLVYFAKDGILLGVYAGFLRSPERVRYKIPRIPSLLVPLAAGAGFGLLEVFNPDLPNLLVGILGFKAYFFYVPLLFIMPAAFASDIELARFLRRYALLAIPVGLLALAQFFSPASSPLNTYARGGEGDAAYISTFGSSEFVRVTATFSYISGYTAYLLATAILLLAILSTTQWRFRGHLKTFLALGMTFLGMLMTGSRGPVVTLGILFPLYWWLAVVRERQSGATFGRLLLGLGLLAAFLIYAGPQAIGAFEGRAAGSAEDASGRVIAPFVAPFHSLADAGPIGFGIGATHQTAAAVTQGIPPYSWLRGVTTEVEPGRVMIELGPVGFFFVYWARFYLAFFALRQVFRLRTLFHRSLAVSAFLFFLAQIPGSVVFDVTADVYYWFFAGILMTVIRLEMPATAEAPRPVPAARPLPRRREVLQPEPS